ncbi:MAG: ABC transporter substrate-binding protein [Nitrososphaerota archaeon]|jgi:ABC-type Fe3+-hydroxamate transport system substrate-binding protein|nr:ABC transporter substrate-binding protein [Nitrososphaerota archaeon]MDG6927288.1 ABC transporter substrate-binding protein [Nitrososphaerota archaeon]MDG6930354.1 ABC transporter substrate-binding protein [Nitrososphaerota archaeon]MDG6931710.1 ABC transporter substrate-binding protein [Nitrososphaerota archaeon]MDG6936758.1 ABC transporter substrate-binding protein [Nitrososphaerota archaeon]
MRKVFCELAGKELFLPDKIERIVSLSPAVTETLYLLGLGKEVVGVTAFDVHPAEAREKPVVASYNKVSMRKLSDLNPDIIFTVTGYQRNTALELSKFYPTYIIELPASVASIIDMVIKVGIVTGKIDESRALSKSLLSSLANVQDRIHGSVYVEIDLGGPVTFGGYSYITDGLSVIGLNNIFSNHFAEWEKPDFDAVSSANPDYIIYEPKMYRQVEQDKVFRMLSGRGWNNIDSKVLVTPGPFDFLAHHGPSFITTALPWIVANAPMALKLK